MNDERTLTVEERYTVRFVRIWPFRSWILMLGRIVALERRAVAEQGGEGLREAVRWFAEQMEAALARHDDRPGWVGERTGWLLTRLNDELRELDFALKSNDPEAAITESVDVANFAMMIADNARRIGARRAAAEQGEPK